MAAAPVVAVQSVSSFIFVVVFKKNQTKQNEQIREQSNAGVF